MCDDIHATLAALRDKRVEVARDVADQGWGLLAAIRLPDGSEFPIYEAPAPIAPITLTRCAHLPHGAVGVRPRSARRRLRDDSDREAR